MIKLKPVLIFLLLMILCLSLNSCLSVNRKIKLNKDGSGTEILTVTFMKEFYSMMSVMTEFMDSTRKESFLDSLYNDEIFTNKTKEKYDSIAGVNITGISSENNGDSSKSFIISYDFDSLIKIGSVLEKTVEDESDIKNPASVTMNDEGDQIVFNYIYRQTEPEALNDNDTLAEQMKASVMNMFGNGFINFEIEFPYEVISSNATVSNGNILTWNYPMTEIIMQSELKLEAVMR